MSSFFRRACAEFHKPSGRDGPCRTCLCLNRTDSMPAISRGLDVPIEGRPDQSVDERPPVVTRFGLVAADYLGMKPTMESRRRDRGPAWANSVHRQKTASRLLHGPRLGAGRPDQSRCQAGLPVAGDRNRRRWLRREGDRVPGHAWPRGLEQASRRRRDRTAAQIGSSGPPCELALTTTLPTPIRARSRSSSQRWTRIRWPPIRKSCFAIGRDDFAHGLRVLSRLTDGWRFSSATRRANRFRAKRFPVSDSRNSLARIRPVFPARTCTSWLRSGRRERIGSLITKTCWPLDGCSARANSTRLG